MTRTRALVTFAAAAVDGPTVSGLAVPFGVESLPSGDGGRYVFTGPPANADDLVDVVREHNTDDLLGRLSAPWDTTDAGLSATARIFDTTRGRDALTEAKEGARVGFSIGAFIDAFTEDAETGVRTVTEWTADHLGWVRRPAFTSAQVSTINASSNERETMTIGFSTKPAPVTFSTGDDDAANGGTGRTLADPPAGAPAVAELPTIAELAEQVSAHLGTPEPAAHALAQFGTFTEFCEAFLSAPDDQRAKLAVSFAVPDQITGDNPGVMPPQWRTDIKKRIDKRQPLIRGFGTVPLPGNGMSSNWPYLDPALDIDTIVAQQAAEKTDLSGVKIKILKGSADIKTAGTVSDISYQLLMRSSPAYLSTYLEICLAAWSRYCEAKFEAALLAAGTDAGTPPDTTTDTKATRAALFAASMDTEDATGAPADLVYVDRDTFETLGGFEDLYNPKYGTQNVAGTSSAATLRIDVNGLNVQYAPFFPADTWLIGGSDAAKFASSGPLVASAEDVRKLGRDVAVWGMYEDAEVYFPAGLRVYQPAAEG